MLDKRILDQINNLFESSDLFGGDNTIRENAKKRFPDIREEELDALEEHLDGFYDYCPEFGDILAEKYKTPFLPDNESAKKETAEYVSEVRKKYPEIDEKHIIEFFSTDCWLTNR